MSDEGRPVTVYMWHFEPPVGRQSHYVGACFTDRLRRRLGEHLTGAGSVLTRRAVQGGHRLILAGLWHGSTWQDEKARKRAGHHNEHCAWCLHGEPLPLGFDHPAELPDARRWNPVGFPLQKRN